jgi:predicted nuclease of predicted toxin-antitoxin system
VSLRLLLDEDVSPRVAEGLRRRGIDAVSVYDVGRARQGIADVAQLAYATTEGRAIVTYNRGDFQRLDTRWRDQGREHAGIVWCPPQSIRQQAIGELVRALAAFAEGRESMAGLCLPLPRPRA